MKRPSGRRLPVAARVAPPRRPMRLAVWRIARSPSVPKRSLCAAVALPNASRIVSTGSRFEGAADTASAAIASVSLPSCASIAPIRWSCRRRHIPRDNAPAGGSVKIAKMLAAPPAVGFSALRADMGRPGPCRWVAMPGETAAGHKRRRPTGRVTVVPWVEDSNPRSHHTPAPRAARRPHTRLTGGRPQAAQCKETAARESEGETYGRGFRVVFARAQRGPHFLAPVTRS